MALNHKKPTFNAGVQAGKKPRIDEDPDAYKEMRPVWRIGQMDWAGPYSWKRHDEGSLLDFWDRLKDLETMRFIDFEGPQKSHPITVGRCCKEAKERLRELGLDQIEHLYSLRLTGRRRAIGIRERNTVRFLWWDPDHAVCPSNFADN